MNAKKNVDAGVAAAGDLLDRIYDAVGDAHRWECALSEIASWIGATGSMYCLLETDSGRPSIRSLHSAGYAESARAAYMRQDHFADPHMPVGIATPISNWFFGQDHFDPRFVEGDPFFQGIMRPLGIRWVAGNRMWEGVGETACLAFHKSADGTPFSDLERMRLGALTPDLCRMSRLHERLTAEGAQAQLGVEAMNRLVIGIAVLAGDGRILFSNASADQVFRQRSVFEATAANRAAPRNSRCRRVFMQAVRDAAEIRTSASLTLVDEHGTLVARAMTLPMPATSRWNTGWQQPLAMMVIHPSQTPRLSADTLRALFDLSAAESRLANALLAGRTMRFYAEERGLSIETVRTQLKSVLAKTGTRGQSQLIATLMALPAIWLTSR
jgi:DNA-binding CsgD family transcriptional regulator